MTPSFWQRALRRSAGRTPSRRPALEVLEDRVVPSILTVTNLADSGAGSLRDRVAAAARGDLIVFDPTLRGTITLTGGELALFGSLTISGPGANLLTVSGGNAQRVFHVEPGASVSISGLTIADGSAPDFGGGIESEGSLNLSSSSLTNNLAGLGGGGLAFTVRNSGPAALTVNNCVITGNRAPNGAGLYSDVANRAGLVTVTVGSTSFSGNTASVLGGGLDSVATLSGSAVASLTVSGGSFSGNAASLGGAVASTLHTADISQGSATLTGGQIQGNSAQNGGGIYNEAVSSDASVATVMLAETLESNAASLFGGGLYSLLTSNDDGRASLTYAGSTSARVDNNTARDGGGVYSQVATNGAGSTAATFTNSQNSFNIASGSGGGLYSLVTNTGSGTATVSLSGGNVSANEAVSSQGGGLYSSVTVTGSGSAGLTNGGTGVAFSDNTAGQSGGGIYATVTNTGSGSASTSAGGFLNGNTAGLGGGGGIFLTVSAQNTGAASATLSGLSASGNATTGPGGGIAATITGSGLGAASVTVSSATAAGNSAGSFGGGLFARLTGGGAGAVGLTVNTSTLTGNNASMGGGLYAAVNTNGPSLRAAAGVTINGTTVSGNRAGTGAGLFFDLASVGFGGAAQAAVNTSTLSANSATGDGGGLFIREQDTATTSTALTVTNSTLYANQGADGGGLVDSSAGLVNAASGVTLLSDTVAYNVASFFGGGLDAAGGLLAVRSSIVAANTAAAGADAAGAVRSAGHNVVGQSTGSSGWGATDLTGTAAAPLDARFGDFASAGGPTRTLALLGDSPAVGHGDPAGPAADQRGVARSPTAPTSGAVEVVQPGSFRVSLGVGSVRAGNALGVTVSALDAGGRLLTTFVGTVHFASSDPNATLPADYTFTTGDNGSHFFAAGVIFQTDGTQTLTVSRAGISGSASILVFSQPASLQVAPAFTTVPAGGPFSVTVSALDDGGNVLTGYDGTVHYTSSDGAATLPADYTFTAADRGTHTFVSAVTLQTPGDQTLSVTGDGVTGTTTLTVTGPVGTWTSLAHFPPTTIGTMILLSDGTVMAAGPGGTAAWYRLTPDATGSYANGTWSQLASANLGRLYYGSNVLPDGRVFVVGGEFFGPSLTGRNSNKGEIYDPVANTWTPIADFPQSSFGDDPTAVLPDGRILAGYISGPQTYIYDPATDSWTFAANKLRNDRSDEETWVTLPDGSILSYDVFHDGHAQRYVPSQNEWVDAGDVPVTLSGSSQELGPAFRLPDGRIFFLGATGHTALYDPAANTWAAGPDIPNGLVTDDAPGAVLPNGRVLFTADPPHTGATTVFEFNPVANTITAVLNAPDLPSRAFNDRMLVLPNGQVLFTSSGTQLYVYTPTGGPDPSWEPTIAGVADNGDGTFTLTGTQLNGLSEGAAYGDDAEMSSNYPIVQLVDASGNVYYARTFGWSVGVATGATPVSVNFTLPAGIPPGTYSLSVVANGIASAPVDFTVGPAAAPVPSSEPTGRDGAAADKAGALRPFAPRRFGADVVRAAVLAGVFNAEALAVIHTPQQTGVAAVSVRTENLADGLSAPAAAAKRLTLDLSFARPVETDRAAALDTLFAASSFGPLFESDI